MGNCTQEVLASVIPSRTTAEVLREILRDNMVVVGISRRTGEQLLVIVEMLADGMYIYTPVVRMLPVMLPVIQE